MLWSPQCGGGIGESDWLVKQGGAEAAHLNQQTDNDSGAGDNDSGGGDIRGWANICFLAGTAGYSFFHQFSLHAYDSQK